MEDILKIGRFVGRIVEARNQGDTEREKQLANDANDLREYLIPTAEAAEETPFEELFKEMSFTAEQRESYLQTKIQDAQELKANAEYYLRETEGDEAPARSYMESCRDTAQWAIELLTQLVGKYQARRIFAGQTNEKAEGTQGSGQCFTINPDTGVVDGRESLCVHSELTPAQKANLFKELCQAKVFVVDNADREDKANALNAFRSFVFGDVVNCSPDYKLKAQQGNLAAFLYALNNLSYYNGNRQYEIAKLWCTQKDGKCLNPDSMSTKGGTEYKKSTKIQQTIKDYFENAHNTT